MTFTTLEFGHYFVRGQMVLLGVVAFPRFQTSISQRFIRVLKRNKKKEYHPTER